MWPLTDITFAWSGRLGNDGKGPWNSESSGVFDTITFRVLGFYFPPGPEIRQEPGDLPGP
jgi:hypothetical protein